MQQEPQPLGTCRFVDGSTRPAYLDAAGKQYVLDDGQRVYGIWLSEQATDPDAAWNINGSYPEADRLHAVAAVPMGR
jgi:hypothetical protein